MYLQVYTCCSGEVVYICLRITRSRKKSHKLFFFFPSLSSCSPPVICRILFFLGLTGAREGPFAPIQASTMYSHLHITFRSISCIHLAIDKIHPKGLARPNPAFHGLSEVLYVTKIPAKHKFGNKSIFLPTDHLNP